MADECSTCENGYKNINDLNEDMLLEIFSKLSIQERVRIGIVCKLWRNLVQSPFFWNKFLSRWPDVFLEKENVYETAVSMCRSSIRVGQERWFCHPLPEFVSYESRLRKAELHHLLGPERSYEERAIRYQTLAVYLRLNPCHHFHEGLFTEEQEMSQLGSYIWEAFRDKVYGRCSCCGMVAKADECTQKSMMTTLLNDHEPQWFCQGLRVKKRELDDQCSVTNALPDEDDTEIPEDNLGQIYLSSEKSIFGPYSDTRAWTKVVNQRLPIHLYKQLKGLLVDHSKHCTHYFFNDGCGDRNIDYDLNLMVCDNAVYYRLIHYDV